MALDHDLRALAERQHGAVARRQARDLGASRDQIRRRAESPDWEVLTPAVMLLVGTARTFRQRAMAATLDAGVGAAVSHLSAAALWRLPGFPTGHMHVSRRTGRSSLATVHRIEVPELHLGRVEGIPVTSVARTIFDLAGVLHPQRTERALDNALARGLTTVPALRQVTEDLVRHGRPGSALMRRLLAARTDMYRPPESNLEARFESILAAAGVDVPRRQRNVGGAAWIGRADYLDPRRRVVVEIDSDLHHSTVLDAEADARRDAALAGAGYRVLRVREDDLRRRPDEVVRRFVAF